MAKTKHIRQNSTAVCLQFLRRSGGKARLKQFAIRNSQFAIVDVIKD
ncbi:hypothetical protein Ava_B0274 (plasmid) [Trichormus variabilis ATCC 29413]|uniref:Uncharacterized protein n=2 Tax=Anabaena variabilis TaxID=264691 RepID=Q3M201_TRIV2|nr:MULTISPECIES: hypothetical protein [Nostocaceae]ABA24985.1 hypothetical protein Ava_B0274 [Trichormus variabilis ATCC 29413]MBC1217791.1 hypothetical protein [Trichormus variabilis ARAD]MBC1259071.1 hypothetical protein [Trichormus variabilis V5]MBC1270730.1 hypothetical protein [Trichormus variabilis FSR]MBC1305579.1 hypothetical protein [Trichormus variabilis N2B]